MQFGLSFSFELIRCLKDRRLSVRRHRFVALPKLTNSGRGAVIGVQHATQALAPLDHACVSKVARFWADESVGQPLVIAFRVIVGNEVVHGGPQ